MYLAMSGASGSDRAGAEEHEAGHAVLFSEIDEFLHRGEDVRYGGGDQVDGCDACVLREWVIVG